MEPCWWALQFITLLLGVSVHPGGTAHTGRARGPRNSIPSLAPAGAPAWHHDLHRLAQKDEVSAVLDYIERIQRHQNCSGINSKHFDAKVAQSSLDAFQAEKAAALRTANTLNNLFRTWDREGESLYNDVFFYSLARALVETPENDYVKSKKDVGQSDTSSSSSSSPADHPPSSSSSSNSPSASPATSAASPYNAYSHSAIFGAAIAFDRDQYKSGDGEDNQRAFSPYVHRTNTPVRYNVKDLAVVTQPKFKYTHNGTEGFEWFWRQRYQDYSKLLFAKDRKVCQRDLGKESAISYSDVSPVVTSEQQGLWTSPYYDCYGAKAWVVTYSVPFFGCSQPKGSTSPSAYIFKGVVAIDINLENIDINQCAEDGSLFAGTHKCKPTTKCVHVPHLGFHRGTYQCHCERGYYFPHDTQHNSNNQYYNGSQVEAAYLRNLLNASDEDYSSRFSCVACAAGCTDCVDGSPCLEEYDVMLRGIPLGIQSFCMTISLVLAVIIVRFRKTKVMKASFWVLLEIIIFGALLLYATVVIQYFKPSELTCMLVPWFREVGFAIVYGALILKIYRVLAEFQSRKAHRVHVRDKDLLKYLTCITLIVVGYMAAWTAINMDHIREGTTMIEKGESFQSGLEYTICKSRWWDYVIEIGEFIFLCFGIYLCHCIRSAPSDYWESRYVSWAIYNETIFSAGLHIARHFLWLIMSPDYIFLMYFLRCQLTVTTTLILVLGPKLWYAHRPPEDEHYRTRAYSSSDVHDSILPESMKLHVALNSNGDVDVGEINLTDMDPEDIRAELKRLYTQLQIYKTKTMRKDNPHISKRRGGRKQTHRRFSLQAFHHKHRHHHRHGDSTASSADHEHEMSRTPEESTNSAEGIGYSIEESVCSVSEVRTPTVTFKPGHQSNIY